MLSSGPSYEDILLAAQFVVVCMITFWSFTIAAAWSNSAPE